jgi:hypothetical protein
LGWEAERAVPLFQQVCAGIFSNIAKLSAKSVATLRAVKVFIGKDSSGMLSFTVRLQDSVYLQDASSSKKKDLSESESMLYYRTFPLDLKQINRFNEESYRLKKEAVDVGELIDLRIYLAIAPLPLAAEVTSTEATAAADTVNPTTTTVDADPINNVTIGSATITDQIDLDSTAPAQPVSSTSFCAELMGWGYDSYFSLGLGPQPQKTTRATQEAVYEPRPIVISRNIAVEQVRMIACSARHTLLLTRLGSIYSCGDNSEGALGLGDLMPR